MFYCFLSSPHYTYQRKLEDSFNSIGIYSKNSRVLTRSEGLYTLTAYNRAVKVFGYSPSPLTHTLFVRIQGWLSTSNKDPELTFYLSTKERSILFDFWQFSISSLIDSVVLTAISAVFDFYENNDYRLDTQRQRLIRFDTLSIFYTHQFKRVPVSLIGTNSSFEIFRYLRQNVFRSGSDIFSGPINQRLYCNPPIQTWHIYRSLILKSVTEVALLLEKVSCLDTTEATKVLRKADLAATKLFLLKLKKSYEALIKDNNSLIVQGLRVELPSPKAFSSFPIFNLLIPGSYGIPELAQAYQLILGLHVLFL